MPCAGNYPPGEPNNGPPNGQFATVACGKSIILIMDAAILVTGAEPAFDLVYYEIEYAPGIIEMDWVVVEIGLTSDGPWFPIFNWGDNVLDANTNIGQLGYGLNGEPDNLPIPTSDLYGTPLGTGIAIDADAVVPPGSYTWIRIVSPLGGDNDGPQVDAIEVLP